MWQQKCVFLLFTAQHASAADQLSLALIWNRADIARTEIFTDDQKWEVRQQDIRNLTYLLIHFFALKYEEKMAKRDEAQGHVNERDNITTEIIKLTYQ